MKRRERTHLFLLVMVLLLGAAVYAELRREQALALDPLTTLDPAAVRALVVTCTGCKTRRFEKVGDHWQMRAPYPQAANDVAIERLVAIARAPVRFRHAAGSLDPAKLGLDPALATLQLNHAVLKFGTTDAIHGDRYVEIGTVIALVPDRFSAWLFETPESELAKPAGQK